jgi:hypothetical protein
MLLVIESEAGAACLQRIRGLGYQHFLRTRGFSTQSPNHTNLCRRAVGTARLRLIPQECNPSIFSPRSFFHHFSFFFFLEGILGISFA